MDTNAEAPMDTNSRARMNANARGPRKSCLTEN